MKLSKINLKTIAIASFIILLISILFSKHLSIFAINLYQNHISPIKGYRCAYSSLHENEPSCSMFGKNSITSEGLIKGLLLLQNRLKDCSTASALLINSHVVICNAQTGNDISAECEKACNDCSTGCSDETGACLNELKSEIKKEIGKKIDEIKELIENETEKAMDTIKNVVKDFINNFAEWVEKAFSKKPKNKKQIEKPKQAEKSLVTTDWGQLGVYQYYYKKGDIPCLVFPSSPNDSYGQKYVVGCTAIALGQIINYYFELGYRRGWLEVMLRDVRVYPRFGFKGNFFDTDCIYPGLATKSSYPKTIQSWDNNDAKALREFLWATALGLDSYFSGDGGSAGAGSTIELLKKYQTPEKKIKTLLIERFRFSSKIYSKKVKRLDAEKENIMKSIDNKQPILLSFHGQHMAVLDDYRINKKGDFEVTINMGWGNKFETNNRWYSGTGPVVVPEGNFKFDTFVLFFNVIPNTYGQID